MSTELDDNLDFGEIEDRPLNDKTNQSTMASKVQSRGGTAELFDSLDLGEDEDTSSSKPDELPVKQDLHKDVNSSKQSVKQNSDKQNEDSFESDDSEEDTDNEREDSDEDLDSFEKPSKSVKIQKEEKKLKTTHINPKTAKMIRTYGGSKTTTIILTKTISHAQKDSIKPLDEEGAERARLIKFLKDQIAYRDKVIKDLKDELKTAKHELIMAVKGLKQLDNENHTVEKLSSDIEVLKAQVKKGREQRKRLEEALASQHEEISKLKESNRSMKQLLKQKGINSKNEESKEQLREKLDQKNEEVTTLKNKLSVLQKIRDQNNDKIVRFNNQVKELKQQISNSKEKIQNLERMNQRTKLAPVLGHGFGVSHHKLDDSETKQDVLNPALSAPKAVHGDRSIKTAEAVNPALLSPTTEKKKLVPLQSKNEDITREESSMGERIKESNPVSSRSHISPRKDLISENIEINNISSSIDPSLNDNNPNETLQEDSQKLTDTTMNNDSNLENYSTTKTNETQTPQPTQTSDQIPESIPDQSQSNQPSWGFPTNKGNSGFGIQKQKKPWEK